MKNGGTLSHKVQALFKEPSDRFDRLVRAAGLDPKTDLRYGIWKNLDFSNLNLAGFDFTGADLTGTVFRDALVSGAVFERAILDPNALSRARDYNADFRTRAFGLSVNKTARKARQTTLRFVARVSGVGVHSGLPSTVTIGPAPIDSGFIFVGSDLDGRDRRIKATTESVIATEFATVIGDRKGPLASTIEHLLAALRGMGIDNATIEMEGYEVPIMDGSAAAFVAAIDQAGILTQSAPRHFIQVIQPVQVRIGDSVGELLPYAAGFRIEATIDFANPAIGRQIYKLDLSPESFRRDISRARTFGSIADVAELWRAGFARGASFENTVVFDQSRLLNAEGLRFSDECVRHKVLAAIGDLALAGLPLLGEYRSLRGGHKLNHAVLSALMKSRSSWRIIEAGSKTSDLQLNGSRSLAVLAEAGGSGWFL